VTASDAHPGRAAALATTWLRLNVEQRVAAAAAALLVVSTFGPFSFVEAAEILAAGAVLTLLKQRADGREFHLPFGDGTAIFAAGVWCGLLIATRFLDRPLGMSVLAMACALLLAAAGLRERARRAPDDLPEPHARQPGIERVAIHRRTGLAPPGGAAPAVPPAAANPSAHAPATSAGATSRRRPKPRTGPDPDPTRQLTFDEDSTVALPEQPPDSD
jgi:hypothetical protein